MHEQKMRFHAFIPIQQERLSAFYKKKHNQHFLGNFCLHSVYRCMGSGQLSGEGQKLHNLPFVTPVPNDRRASKQATSSSLFFQ
jgi:hypothetical protein